MPIYDRLNPPQLDRHLGHRARIEELVAFRALYARDKEATLASMHANMNLAADGSD